MIYNGAAKAEALVTLGTGFTSAEDYPFRDVFGWQVLHFKAHSSMYPTGSVSPLLLRQGGAFM